MEATHINDPAAMAAATAARPLEGIRVLDLTVALAGPFCTLMLAGLGAEVIKIESPDGNDIARTNPPFIGPEGLKFSEQEPGDISTSLLNRSRGKKSVTLDLKSARGVELFRQLARECDVVVENLSEGTAARLGVGYEDIRKENPDIVYASIMGLGQPSDYPGMKVMDIIVQALSGVMEATGDVDGPPTRSGIPLGDLVAPMFALSGILAAVVHRQRTGQGQKVTVSMLDALVSCVAAEQFERLQQPGTTPRTGNHYDRFAPFGIYPARDGYVAIGAPRDEWAQCVFEAMGCPEMIEDERFRSRSARMLHSHELNARIVEWTRRHTRAEVVRMLFAERGVPCSEVRGPLEALADPHVRARGAVAPLCDPRTGEVFAMGVGVPITMSACSTQLPSTVPSLGEHNREILGELLHLKPEMLDELAACKVI